MIRSHSVSDETEGDRQPLEDVDSQVGSTLPDQVLGDVEPCGTRPDDANFRVSTFRAQTSLAECRCQSNNFAEVRHSVGFMF
jgi:hypothetical protein